MSHIYSTIGKTIRYVLMFFALLATFCPKEAEGQCSNTTQGKDFWYMFLDNYDNDVTLSLVITAANNQKSDGTQVYVQVYVSNPNLPWGKTVQVPVGGSVVVSIPKEKALTSTVNDVSNYGMHIKSNVDVSVYASNFNDATYDIATIYPTTTLDTEYVVQTYDGLSSYGTEVGFVASEFYTVLSMKLPCDLNSGDYKKGDSLIVELDEGQSIQLQAASGGNLSGMRVTSNGHPFAAFQGTGCANVPTSCSACDHLYEQTLPLKMWDQKYVIVPSAEHTKGDRAIVTAAYDSCLITYDNEPLCTLNAGQSKEFEVSSSSSHLLESSSPCTVCLYIKGAGCSDGIGDPAAVIIPPASQGLNKVRFQAIGTQRTKYHYVNIIVPTDAKDSMYLDSATLSGTFKDLDCGYSTIQLSVDTGTHTLYNPLGKFVSYFYGLGEYESYAYIAGMSLRNLKNRIYVDTVDKTDDPTPYITCFGNTVNLKAKIDDYHKPASWYIDSEYVYYIDTAIQYYFDKPGLHRVDALSPNGCDTLTAYVFCRAPSDTIEAEICFGEEYKIDTFAFNSTGYHTATLIDSYGCDSLVTVDLTIIDSSYTVLVDTACWFDTYTWLGVRRDSTGYYTDTLTSTHGCDSVVALDLTILPVPPTPFSYQSHCEDGSYTIAVDVSAAAVNGVLPSLKWFSEPPDSTLVGQESELQVTVLPKTHTVYGVDVAYRCRYTASIALNVVDVPHAAFKVTPEKLDYDNTSFDAYDDSKNANRRQWWVNDQLMSEQGSMLHYTADVRNTDSVNLMLVASDGICSDTARQTIPVWHTGLYAPNVFIPSDYAYPRFVVQVNDAELKDIAIFNRAGMCIYYNDTNPSEGWDGTHNDKPCPQGAYVWIATYKRYDTPERQYVAKGTFTLLR